MRTVTSAKLMLEPRTAEHAEAMFAVLSDPAIYTCERFGVASPSPQQQSAGQLGSAHVEGHELQPAELCGAGFLQAIREVS
ncbi:hypothetical protein GCM10009107_62260 [Ideonella azotifigens]|uniref:GNAT family N-acetyltransferase n=1 Tax=Ideonella azotifigens TaxID=513160 RepID=A0ABN1KMA4_9BURK